MAKAVVKSVDRGSIADECGIVPGDVISKINGKSFADILDFRYFTSDEYYVVEVEKSDGSIEEIEVSNDLYEQFGCEFEKALIDEPMLCTNRCVFCFMDQLPPNMRKTMYFKDDDVRLSFLEGNYVTLTNLKEKDIERICSLRVSPINISVHTTDSALRCKMLNNRFAGSLLGTMRRFADAGIIMNAQIVLCRGLNDGEQLKKTLLDLRGLYPSVQSISVVPVGISGYREGLYELEGFGKEASAEVIEQVNALSARFLDETGTRLVYLADEFYIKAGLELPDYEAYEDFPQIENGVGLMTALKYELGEALNSPPVKAKPAKKSIATSEIAYDYICSFAERIKSVYKNADISVYKIKNNFFGGQITVTGLLCGCDIISQLRGKPLGEYLVLSKSMFKDDCDVFLDDTSREDVERELGVKVLINDNSGADFLAALLK